MQVQRQPGLVRHIGIWYDQPGQQRGCLLQHICHVADVTAINRVECSEIGHTMFVMDMNHII